MQRAMLGGQLLHRVNWGRVDALVAMLAHSDAMECVEVLVEISGPLFRLEAISGPADDAAGRAAKPVTRERDELLTKLALREVLELAHPKSAPELERACCEWIDTGRVSQDVDRQATQRIGVLVSTSEQRLGLLSRFAPAIGAVRALEQVPPAVRDNIAAGSGQTGE